MGLGARNCAARASLRETRARKVEGRRGSKAVESETGRWRLTDPFLTRCRKRRGYWLHFSPVGRTDETRRAAPDALPEDADAPAPAPAVAPVPEVADPGAVEAPPAGEADVPVTSTR